MILQRMDKQNAAFGERLEALLETKKMTQTELATEIGVQQSAISMMIGRNRRPHRRTIEKIAKALKVVPEEALAWFQR